MAKKMFQFGIPAILLVFVITVVGCLFNPIDNTEEEDEDNGKHTHTYSKTWSKNAAQHWKKCTGAGCNAKTGTADHTLDDGICTICEYDTVHTHTYSTAWSKNEAQHWRECTVADCDAKTGTANHAPADGICTTCWYNNTPTHTHTYSATWSKDTAQHWKECTGAGCEAVTDTTDHTLADGICTTCEYAYTHTHTYTTWSKDPTHHWRECTGAGCDAIETAVHDPAVGTCTTCGYYNAHAHLYGTTWIRDAAQHWKECMYVGCEVKGEAANHALADGICITCGYAHTTHTYSTAWSKNEAQHWRECTVADCDAKTGTANHAPADGICTTCGYDTHIHTYIYTVISTSYPAQSIQICRCDKTIGTARDTIIGDIGPAGGTIFYINAEGFLVQGYAEAKGAFTEYTARYMEAAPANEGTLSWSTALLKTSIAGVTTFTKATDSNASLIGNGRKDTQIIVNRLGTSGRAAKACADKKVTVRGTVFNDWFLPSL